MYIGLHYIPVYAIQFMVIWTEAIAIECGMEERVCEFSIQTSVHSIKWSKPQILSTQNDGMVLIFVI